MCKQGAPKPLAELRQRIDRLDDELLEKLSERARCAQEVANAKRAESGGEAPVFYRPERDSQVLRRLSKANKGPLGGDEVCQVFRQIISVCLALQEPLKVAYLGPEGTFTHTAALHRFGDAAIGMPLATVDDVFREVASETCQYGLVPVENSAEGVVSHTLDNFIDSPLSICGEVELRVHHHLMAGGKTKPDAIARIYSHQQTLGQCRRWLLSHYPKTPAMAVASNAEAAKRAAAEKGAAAIAGEQAAELYGLQILARRIEDAQDNSTRFLVVGQGAVAPSGEDKTSIMVATRNQPGALYKLLEPFHRQQISLTSVVTRPSRTGKWLYVFFIDFEGHQDEPLIAELLRELEAQAAELKLLGSYPRAVSAF